MSTEALNRSDEKLFSWHGNLAGEDYVFATYVIESAVDPALTALAMAKEQTATTAALCGYQVNPAMAARVVDINPLGATDVPGLPEYWLHTHAYPESTRKRDGFWKSRITIAYPLINLNRSLSHVWNVVVGELPRLGYLNAIRLTALDLPQSFIRHFPGPRHGMSGLRQILNIQDRPLFCRSTRPAVGLDLAAMCAINHSVLRGGFDVVKDDELTVNTESMPYRQRVTALAEITRRAEQDTGEKKIYFANIIDDYSKSMEQLDIATAAGADGIIIAPCIQGLAIAAEIARRSDLLILAHNTVDDIFCRHPKFGVSHAVYLSLLRLSGADLVFLPGTFGSVHAEPQDMQDAVTACVPSDDQLRAACPIIAGGKRPEKLAEYISAIGSTDFMIIAATAVDDHPQGLEAGARAFRTAWEELIK